MPLYYAYGPGRGVDDGKGNKIGEEIGWKACWGKYRRHVIGKRFSSGSDDQARFSGSAITGNNDSDTVPSIGAKISGENTRHWIEKQVI